MTVPPRQLVHRGRILADAMLVRVEPIGADAARARVLRAWQPGAEVRATADGWLLRWREPVSLRADVAPGAPLVAVEGALHAAPLCPDERVPGPLIAVVGGDAVPIDAQERVDPSRWLDASGFAAVAVRTLGAPPSAVHAPPPVRVERGDFAVGDADPEVASVLAALNAPARPRDPSWGAVLRGWLAGGVATGVVGVAGLLGLIARPGGEGSAPSPLRRLIDTLDGLAARLARTAGLGALLGSRHAAYVGKLLDDLLGDDLDAALRRAIPLGGGVGGCDGGFSLPGARDKLEIGPRRSGGGALTVQEDLFEELRRTYREVASRLERQGRIEEAAFVLGELLGAAEEAVALLERHERYALAAKVADTRELDPGLRIRLWMLAGDAERAVVVARLHEAWLSAVLRLEKTHPKLALALRLRWVLALDAAGRYAAAVHALQRPDTPLARELAWKAIALGGPDGARMLAEAATHMDDAEARSRLVTLLTDRDPAGDADRAAAAAALDGGPRDLTRLAARAMLRARARGYAPERLSGTDPLFAADVPAELPARLPPSIEARLEQTGAYGIRAVVRLPDGGFLLGLGEDGMVITDRTARVVAHLDQPAFELVPNDARTHVVAIAPREGLSRLARVDVASRTATWWADARFSATARDTDGDRWLVAERGRLCVLDLHAPDLRTLWSVPEMPVVEISRAQRSFAVRTFADQVFVYDSATLRLKSRAQVPDGVLDGEGRVYLPRLDATRRWRVQLLASDGTTVLHHHQLDALDAAGRLVVGGPWVVSSAEERVVAIRGVRQVRLGWPPTVRCWHLTPSTLTGADDAGRVVVVHDTGHFEEHVVR